MLNHLNDQDVNGNTMAWMTELDRNNAPRHKDQYRCSCCSELVHGEDFNEEYKLCRECYSCMAEDHYVPPFDGINEYYGEDR